MEFTGERYVPGIFDETPMAFEHWQRYIAARKFSKDKTVLDIACGEGYGADLLAQDAAAVYGVDISEESIRHASEKYVRENVTFRTGSVEAIEFPDDFFDLIVSFETIEHVDVEIQEKFMQEATRTLKNDGMLIISCPNRKVASEFAWEHWQYKNEFHLKEYYIDEFKEFLSKYFESVNLLYQRNENCLILSGSEPARMEVVLNREQQFEHTQNIIAICSNSKLERPSVDLITFHSPKQYLEQLATIANFRKECSLLQKECGLLQRAVNEVTEGSEILKYKNIQLLQENERLKEEQAVLVQEKQAIETLVISTRQEVDNLNRQITGLKKQNAELQDRTEKYQQELARIYNSRGWKCLALLYKCKRFVLNKLLFRSGKNNV